MRQDILDGKCKDIIPEDKIDLAITLCGENQADDAEGGDSKFKDEMDPYKDWRDQGIGALRAFFTCQCRYRDYRVIISFTVCHFVALLISLVMSGYSGSKVGIALIFVAFLHFTWIPLSLASNAITN